MTAPSASAARVPHVGQTWKRVEGKQRIRLMRIWRAGRGLCPSEPEIEGQIVVLGVPRNGGRDTLLTLRELHEHFQLVETEVLDV